MKKKHCPWSKKCRNGGGDCWTKEPERCIRYLPTEGTNLTSIDGIVETPPDIDDDKFIQYFTNWLDAMGWSFSGSFKKYEEDDNHE